MALRRARRGGKRLYRVTGVGRSNARLLEARKRGALDSFSVAPEEMLPFADLVVLCTPVSAMGKWVKKNRSLFKPGAVLTDAGSVKASLVKEMAGFLRSRPDLEFVGAHPLAGSEKSGIAFAQAEMFRGAVCVLTPETARFGAVKAVVDMWVSVGATCLMLKPAEHDEKAAFTSHLPHLMAFALVSLIQKEARKDPTLWSLVAGSFKDMTRIAASDPHLWAGLFQANGRHLRSALQGLVREMSGLLAKSGRPLEAHLRKISSANKNW